MDQKGIFITFEGGEGAGKSSAIASLSEILKSRGYTVLATREPGGTPLGEEIRRMLLEKKQSVAICPVAELFLFLSARAQHLDEVILPALSRGAIVLCDRFNDSTIAYQGYARGLGVGYVTKLCNLACRDFHPDLTLLLDVPTEEGLKRTRQAQKENAASGDVDRIESEAFSFHEKVRRGLLQQANEHPERFSIIDARRPLEDVIDSAAEVVLAMLAAKCSNI